MNNYTEYLHEYKSMIKLAIINAHKTQMSISSIATHMLGVKLDRCVVEEGCVAFN